jgi:hypothetical protein
MMRQEVVYLFQVLNIIGRMKSVIQSFLWSLNSIEDIFRLGAPSLRVTQKYEDPSAMSIFWIEGMQIYYRVNRDSYYDVSGAH